MTITRGERNTVFQDPFSEEVWRTTYKDHKDENVDDTFRRVATAIASVEETPELREEWGEKFYDMLKDFKVIPGGRILANAGTEWNGTTLMNCISGETKVHTIDGIVEANTLVGRTVKTLSKGSIFRDAVWKSYGEQRLYKVTLSNDEILYATRDHKWIASHPSRGYLYEVENRYSTTEIVGRNVPVVPYVMTTYDEITFKDGFINGMVYGDGWEDQSRRYSSIAQFKDNTHLLLDNFEGVKFRSYNGIELGRAQVNNLPAYYKQLPVGATDVSYLRGFVAGLIATDGCISSSGHVMIFQSSLVEINQIRQICANVGIPSSSVCLYREASPYDGTIKPLYCLRLCKSSFYNDRKLVAKNTHRNYLEKSAKPKYLNYLKVISVEETDRVEEVFCCEEPETHTMVIGSGILTGQCFVGGLPEENIDSIEGIYQILVEQSLTLKSEGGWGMNFDWGRPRGSMIHGVGVESPGIVRFMELFDKSSEIVTAGSGREAKSKKAKGKIRKGAQMSVLSVNSPDIVEFIMAKQTPGRLTKFNMSVNCTNSFMEKVNLLKSTGQDSDWELVFPDTTHVRYSKDWRGDIEDWKHRGYPVVVHDIIKVSKLWELITSSTYSRNEPGILFLDRANEGAPFSYGEKIKATNP